MNASRSAAVRVRPVLRRFRVAGTNGPDAPSVGRSIDLSDSRGELRLRRTRIRIGDLDPVTHEFQPSFDLDEEASKAFGPMPSTSSGDDAVVVKLIGPLLARYLPRFTVPVPALQRDR